MSNEWTLAVIPIAQHRADTHWYTYLHGLRRDLVIVPSGKVHAQSTTQALRCMIRTVE
jgi:hypothetical protein